jgi:hypothetical protein
MIDVYAPAGTLRDRTKLVRDLAAAVMTIERVPNIPLFRQNTATAAGASPVTRTRMRSLSPLQELNSARSNAS